MVFPVRGSAGGSGQPAPAPPVIITTTGSTFAPWLTGPADMTVTWTWAGGSATGLTPNINFGTAATRQVTMTAALGGYNALSQIQMFNVGFDANIDPGLDSLPGAYNLAQQNVTSILNVNSMSGLQWFLAMNNSGLGGILNCSGMSKLQHLEVYGAAYTSVNLTGCTSILRLNIELNQMIASNGLVDLNPIAGNLYDLRAAHMNLGVGGMTFAPLTAPLARDYHFCIRDQQITGMPNFATQLPVVKQLWIYNCGQSGAFAPVSSQMYDILAYSNSYTSCDVTNQFPANPGPPPTGTTTSGPALNMHSNSLASVTLTGCPGLVYIDLSNNLLPQAQVDGVLATVDGFGTSGGTLNLGGTGNAAPSATGTTHKTNLTGRGWTVTTN